ncbi:hypothetical protein LTS15_002221 [Exophiala xenobiotica]|nr:hypothetical protein LTS15_002221 [Exophiala xenobiotica]
MDGYGQREEGSMRRARPSRTAQLPRSNVNSSRGPNTDDDSDNSRCPSPLLTVDGGYRIDPFLRYPVSRVSKGVQFMTDYYIQIWAPQQAQSLRMQNDGSSNVLLTLILPLALQNAMLFEATIGMTRAAWLLRRGSEPLEDKMLLRHKGATLLHLRNMLEGGRQSRSDLVLLTMSTLLTFNYMVDDVESFEVHLRALENMLQSYDPDEDNELQNFVRGRVLAFGVLASFMHAHQPSYATRINEPGHRISVLTYPGHPFPPDLCKLIAKLPEGFAEVALSRNIAIEFISFLARLAELVHRFALATDQRMSTPRPEMTMQRAIYDLQCLSALPLNKIEAQMVRALLAFCLHLFNEVSFHIPLARPLRPIIEGFNEQKEIPRHPWLRLCLLWCSMAIASSWDAQIDASPERHAVLDGLIALLEEAKSWESMQEMMGKFFWHGRLTDHWEVCWRAAFFRSRRYRRGASQMASIPQLLIDNSRESSKSSDDLQ